MSIFIENVAVLDACILACGIVPMLWFKINGRNDVHDRISLKILFVFQLVLAIFVIYSIVITVTMKQRIDSDKILNKSMTIYVNQSSVCDSDFLDEFYNKYEKNLDWAHYYDTLSYSIKEKKIGFKKCLKLLLKPDYTQLYKFRYNVKKTTGVINLNSRVTVRNSNGHQFALADKYVFAEGMLCALDNKEVQALVYYDKSTVTKKGYIVNYKIAECKY